MTICSACRSPKEITSFGEVNHEYILCSDQFMQMDANLQSGQVPARLVGEPKHAAHRLIGALGLQHQVYSRRPQQQSGWSEEEEYSTDEEGTLQPITPDALPADSQPAPRPARRTAAELRAAISLQVQSPWNESTQPAEQASSGGRSDPSASDPRVRYVQGNTLSFPNIIHACGIHARGEHV